MRVRVYSQKSEASNKIMSNWQGMQSNSLNKSINTVPTIFPGFLMIYGSLTETKTLLLYKKKKSEKYIGANYRLIIFHYI